MDVIADMREQRHAENEKSGCVTKEGGVTKSERVEVLAGYRKSGSAFLSEYEREGRERLQ